MYQLFITAIESNTGSYHFGKCSKDILKCSVLAALAREHVSNAASGINELSTELFKKLMVMSECRNKTFIRHAKFKLSILGSQWFHSLWKLALLSSPLIAINKAKL